MFDICPICPVATFISFKTQNPGLKKLVFCSCPTDVTFGSMFHLQTEMIGPELHSPAHHILLSRLSVTLSVTMRPFGTASRRIVSRNVTLRQGPLFRDF